MRGNDKVELRINGCGFSKTNPYSGNYDSSAVEVQMVDNRGNNVFDQNVVKTVVFSQWTSMLDK